MKKIILFAACALSVSSAAYALRISMWRLIHEQNKTKTYYDVGTLVSNKSGWSFNTKMEKKEGWVTSTTNCKESEKGVWTRYTNRKACDEEGCIKTKDTDWVELETDKIGYAVCMAVLPYCDEKKDKKNKDGFCRNKEDE